MKRNREHRVPLVDRCFAILREVHQLRQNDHVFPGSRTDAISPHPMRRLLANQATARRCGFRQVSKRGRASAQRFRRALEHALVWRRC
jgi:hypothetical protein